MKFLPALLAGIVGTAFSASIDSCLDQDGCIVFSVTKVTDGSVCTGECYWNVCMKLVDTGDCPKVSCTKYSSASMVYKECTCLMTS